MSFRKQGMCRQFLFYPNYKRNPEKKQENPPKNNPDLSWVLKPTQFVPLGYALPGVNTLFAKI